MPVLKRRRFRVNRPVNMKRHWMNGEVVATAFYNNLSISFPHAEVFMISSLKAWHDRVSPNMRDEIDAFIDQELNHSREHVAFNRGMLESGYESKLVEDKVNRLVKKLNERSDMFKLHMTACMEHLTAIISSELLSHEHHLEGAEPELKELWLWHATEEVEHKAVAFNVMKEVTQNWSALRRYCYRCALFTGMSYRFLVNRLSGQIYLLKQDGYGGFEAFWALMRYGLKKNGLMRNLIVPWMQFYKPNFHPWDIDDRHLIAVGESKFNLSSADKRYPKSESQIDNGDDNNKDAETIVSIAA